jgi:serine O-acetyltransferase
MGLMATLRADFAAVLAIDDEPTRSLRRRQLDVLTLPGFWAVAIFRVSAVAHRAGLFPVARLLMVLNLVLFSCEISPRATIGPGFLMPHPQGVTIGAGMRIGARVRALRGVALGTAGYADKRRDGWPIIGDDCVLYDMSKVFGPVEIGDRSTVGNNVVLFSSVPPDSVVVVQTTNKVTPARAPTTPDLDQSTGDTSTKP